MPNLLDQALALAALGWPVFPLHPDAKRPALHGERACPRTGPCQSGHRKWEQRASTDPRVLTRAWGHGRYNIGLATGPAHLLVIDLDLPKHPGDTPPAAWAGHRDGTEVFATVCARAGQPIPTGTYTVQTGSGGLHLYFTAPPNLHLPSTNGESGLGWKVDTRAWGGYVIAPTSTVGGHPYTLVRDVPVAPLPDWLAHQLTPTTPARVPVRVPEVRRRVAYADAALRNECANVAHAREGSRNQTLTRAARALARFTRSGELPYDTVLEALKGAGAACGLRPYESEPTIRSAIRWALANDKATR